MEKFVNFFFTFFSSESSESSRFLWQGLCFLHSRFWNLPGQNTRLRRFWRHIANFVKKIHVKTKVFTGTFVFFISGSFLELFLPFSRFPFDSNFGWSSWGNLVCRVPGIARDLRRFRFSATRKFFPVSSRVSCTATNSRKWKIGSRNKAPRKRKRVAISFRNTDFFISLDTFVSLVVDFLLSFFRSAGSFSRSNFEFSRLLDFSAFQIGKLFSFYFYRTYVHAPQFWTETFRGKNGTAAGGDLQWHAQVRALFHLFLKTFCIGQIKKTKSENFFLLKIFFFFAASSSGSTWRTWRNQTWRTCTRTWTRPTWSASSSWRSASCRVATGILRTPAGTLCCRFICWRTRFLTSRWSPILLPQDRRKRWNSPGRNSPCHRLPATAAIPPWRLRVTPKNKNVQHIFTLLVHFSASFLFLVVERYFFAKLIVDSFFVTYFSAEDFFSFRKN